MPAIVFITVGTFIFALSVLGVLGARSKSRTLLLIVRPATASVHPLRASLTRSRSLDTSQYIVGIGACLGALLVCAVGGFSFSGSLAKTYAQRASENSSLACEIELDGCSNCSVVPSEVLPCTGVRKTSDGYWVACDAKAANASDASCQPGMTVLNAREDQGFQANDVRAVALSFH